MLKLTIAVPTYNRSAYLERAVNSVVLQLPEVDVGIVIEICIMDNASTDDTPKVCNSLQERHPSLKIIRHPVNIGGDRNILRALTDADGDFIWVFGDDDFLLPGALRMVTRNLISGDNDIVKLSTLQERDARTGSEARFPLRTATELPSPAGVFRTRNYLNADEILSTFGMDLANISTAIFATSFFRRWYNTPDQDLFHSGYAQLEWIYRGLYAAPERLLHVTSPAIAIRIEMVPRHVSGERVAVGLNILRNRLIEFGFNQEVAEKFYFRQADAIRIANIKARKFLRQPVAAATVHALRQIYFGRNRLKILIIAAIPSILYRRLWIQL